MWWSFTCSGLDLICLMAPFLNLFWQISDPGFYSTCLEMQQTRWKLKLAFFWVDLRVVDELVVSHIGGVTSENNA